MIRVRSGHGAVAWPALCGSGAHPTWGMGCSGAGCRQAPTAQVPKSPGRTRIPAFGLCRQCQGFHAGLYTQWVRSQLEGPGSAVSSHPASARSPRSQQLMVVTLKPLHLPKGHRALPSLDSWPCGLATQRAHAGALGARSQQAPQTVPPSAELWWSQA